MNDLSLALKLSSLFWVFTSRRTEFQSFPAFTAKGLSKSVLARVVDLVVNGGRKTQ